MSFKKILNKIGTKIDPCGTPLNIVHDKNLKFKLEGIEIECETEVKLLGVTIDFKLNFNEHISNICKKASRQLNVFKRIGKHLTKLGKLTIYYDRSLNNFINFNGQRSLSPDF
jgi:hypothetical protein